MAQDPKPTQAPLLCATGCGFYGNPRTNGMCSVCYRDSLQKHNGGGRVSEPDLSVEPFTAGLDKSKPKKNRCFTCRRKVGLTGFGCRCGNLFCGVHRYSDLHSCTFDYKADAAQKIRKENPVIVGERIKKI